jgi:high-affinity Fe2+/Pb2+ permease
MIALAIIGGLVVAAVLAFGLYKILMWIDGADRTRSTRRNKGN